MGDAMIELRWYQSAAKDAIYDYLATKQGNPCVVLPTASGKTPLLASICTDIAGSWGGRVLVLAHVKELLQQAVDKLQGMLPAHMVGIYSAGLDSRDTSHPVIVAGIQSVHKRAGELGAFSAIIIDEAHLIPEHDGGMYRTFLDHARIVNPQVRIIGLTATPYRMDSGYICGPDNVLNEICYEVGVKELIVQGYLCPLKTRAGKDRPDLSGVAKRGGEYVESEMAERMDAIVVGACEEIAHLTATRKSVLIFASSLAHGRHVQTILAQITELEVGFVCGDTASGERAELLDRFKAGTIKYLVNCQVLTTGFDAPNIDAVVLLRATLSPGLYYQMVGRGFRIHPSKTDCIVLDYGENTVRHGPVDAIKITDKTTKGEGEAPAKECPQCRAVVFAGVARCPECGYEFPFEEHGHKDKAGKSGILSGEVTTVELTVLGVKYYDHQKRGDPDAKHTLRVEYEVSYFPPESKKEWLCFDHEGWPRQRAEQWWRDRSLVAVPRSVESAVQLAKAGALANTTSITWREVAGEKFGSVIGYEIDDEKPTPASVDAALVMDDKVAAEFEETFKPSNGDWFDNFKNDDIPF